MCPLIAPPPFSPVAPTTAILLRSSAPATRAKAATNFAAAQATTCANTADSNYALHLLDAGCVDPRVFLFLRRRSPSSLSRSCKIGNGRDGFRRSASDDFRQTAVRSMKRKADSRKDRRLLCAR